MKIEDCSIGLEFFTATGRWRCTDIGTRVVAAIQIDQVEACKQNATSEPTIEIITDDSSWFNGPPYAVAEHVFNEFDLGGCSLDSGVFTHSSV